MREICWSVAAVATACAVIGCSEDAPNAAAVDGAPIPADARVFPPGDARVPGAHAGPLDDVLRLDHVQVRGTHNSYHVEPETPVHDSHRYTHAPLGVQLADQGVRAFELDLHKDVEDSDELTVYHIALADPESTCPRLVDCLIEIKLWSDANAGHLPIVVWFELKDDAGGYGIDDVSIVDDAIRSVFPDDLVYAPDDLQGSYGSPRERIETAGWPTLGEVRGQTLFVVLSVNDATERYSAGYTSLQGRAMFVRADEAHYDSPWAAITKINDPRASDAIAAAHAAGLLVASNVCGADELDADCEQALAAGIANGVHMLKDDFPAPVASRSYWLELPDGNPARCNDVTAPVECTAQAVEDL